MKAGRGRKQTTGNLKLFSQPRNSRCAPAYLISLPAARRAPRQTQPNPVRPDGLGRGRRGHRLLVAAGAPEKDSSAPTRRGSTAAVAAGRRPPLAAGFSASGARRTGGANRAGPTGYFAGSD